ncbi:MAG: hypothetical protein J0H19_02850 [Rhodospirillales bacterium]|nr:hypothetical protein [Rhodospirillales bacterium]
MSATTMSVTFEVTSLRRLHGAGPVVALASVSVDLDGVELELHGLQVRRRPDGLLECKAPHFRDTTGRWRTAITLPPELEDAIGREVIAAVIG